MIIDTFTQQYLETAVWADSPDGDTFDVADLAPEAVTAAAADCAAFQAAHWAEIADRESDAGHDFWLTRNRHGAGFWDGDWPLEVGDRLTAAAHRYGERNLYRGDDGQVYFD